MLSAALRSGSGASLRESAAFECGSGSLNEELLLFEAGGPCCDAAAAAGGGEEEEDAEEGAQPSEFDEPAQQAPPGAQPDWAPQGVFMLEFGDDAEQEQPEDRGDSAFGAGLAIPGADTARYSRQRHHAASGAPGRDQDDDWLPLAAAHSRHSSETARLESASSSGSGARFGCGYGLPVARSCPKPIVTPRRQPPSRAALHDELSVFVPPHMLADGAMLDPTHMADSLCRKGSAALRLRAGVLRRLGYFEGHTETLRAQSSLKP